MDQIISIARTKKVVTKGRISVSHGQCVKMANASAAVDIKNNNQYKPVFLLRTSIGLILRKNRAGILFSRIITQKQFQGRGQSLKAFIIFVAYCVCRTRPKALKY